MKKQKQISLIEVDPFGNYPDVLTVKDLCQALHIGRLGAYKLLEARTIQSFKIGRIYKIPKDFLICYMNEVCNTEQKGDARK